VQFQAQTSGTYTVTLEPLNDFTGVVNATLIEIADDTEIEVIRGQQFTLTLATPGQRASASFNAAAGDTYTVTGAGVHLIAIGPSDGFTGSVEFVLQ